jgi:hypothetical protein
MSAEEVGGEQEDIIDVNAIQLDVTPTAGAGQQALVPFDKLPDEEEDKAFAAVELAVMSGDYGQLSPQASFALVRRRCEALQVDITQGPFVWGKDRKGKKMLIPVKNLYQQLRANRDIKLEVEEERVDAELGIYYLRIKASMGNNRTDTDISAVSIKNPDGSFMNPEGIANAMKVCWTQAKNRVTGSICAVGGMDESEQQSSREEQIKNRLFDADPNPQPRMIARGWKRDRAWCRRGDRSRRKSSRSSREASRRRKRSRPRCRTRWWRSPRRRRRGPRCSLKSSRSPTEPLLLRSSRRSRSS